MITHSRNILKYMLDRFKQEEEGGAGGRGQGQGAEEWGKYYKVVQILGLTSLSLQEKSFFFFPGAQFSGLPAASVHRGNVRKCVCLIVCVLLCCLESSEWNQTVLNLVAFCCISAQV